MITLADLKRTGMSEDATCTQLASMARNGDKDAANNLAHLEREIRAERASQRANANLDPGHKRILAGLVRGVVDTKSTVRATMRGNVLYMPQQTLSQAQARAALVEIEAELDALHREMGR